MTAGASASAGSGGLSGSPEPAGSADGPEGWEVRLVRDTFGCRCPPEVFQEVDTRPGADLGGIPARWRIAVGGRLLVYVVDADGALDLTERLIEALRQGRAERDHSGFNRLRVVVVGDATAALEDSLERARATVPEDDDRMHLHLRGTDDLGVTCG
jgi:hypothetical protein